LSSYPSAESFDREGYVKIAIKALAGYPDDLLAYLADPGRGIVRHCKFIPSIAEMCAYMDEEWHRRQKRAEQDQREQLRALPAPEPLVDEETRARIVKEFDDLRRHLHANRDPMKKEKVLSKVEIKEQAEAWLAVEELNPYAPKLSKAALKTLRN
jgi:hypothetical protein